VIERTIDQYTPGDFMEDWDLDGLFTALGQFFPLDLGGEDLDPETVDRVSLTDRITSWRWSATTRARRRSARS
jgi:preprotein translocase subunit SecA